MTDLKLLCADSLCLITNACNMYTFHVTHKTTINVTYSCYAHKFRVYRFST